MKETDALPGVCEQCGGLDLKRVGVHERLGLGAENPVHEGIWALGGRCFGDRRRRYRWGRSLEAHEKQQGCRGPAAEERFPWKNGRRGPVLKAAQNAVFQEGRGFLRNVQGGFAERVFQGAVGFIFVFLFNPKTGLQIQRLLRYGGKNKM